MESLDELLLFFWGGFFLNNFMFSFFLFVCGGGGGRLSLVAGHRITFFFPNIMAVEKAVALL